MNTEQSTPISPVACAKCGGTEIGRIYHARGCDRDICSCSKCGYSDHNKDHDEHLHRYCRDCRYDWVEPVLAYEAVPA